MRPEARVVRDAALAVLGHPTRPLGRVQAGCLTMWVKWLQPKQGREQIIPDKMADMTTNARLDAVLNSVIQDTLMEGDILEHATIDTESVMRLCRGITERLPEVEADLRKRFPEEDGGDPDHFLPEVVLSLVHLGWDYGFRAGRIFEARDYGLTEEEQII
jgi:hypothetical protein